MSENELEVLGSAENLEETILDTMTSLGNKFARIAQDAKQVEQAKSAFHMAVQAYGLALKAKKEIKVNTPSSMSFLKQVSGNTKRALVWKLYLEYCKTNGQASVSKGIFFSLMDNLGFKQRLNQGEYISVPPKEQRKVGFDWWIDMK